MLRLVMAYMRERRLTTALNVLLLAISVSMLVLLMQFARQVEERFLDGAQGIDLVVGAKGSPLQLVLSSVYHLDEPTGNIPLSALGRLRCNPMVASAIPLALGDQFDAFRIVGTEPALLDLYNARLASGRQFAAPLEAVLGAEVARRTGAGIGQRFVGSHGLAGDEDGQGHDATPFEVVGILAPTGKPVDRLIVTSLESVWDVHGIEHHQEEEPGHASEAEITAILLSYRSPAATVRLPGMINRNTAMQAASPATESTRMLGLFEPAIGAVRAFGLLLALVGGLAIFVALFSAVRSREGDLALLRVMGASRGYIVGTVLLEGAITAILAAAAGIALAHGLIWLAAMQFQSLAETGIVAGRFYRDEIWILLGAVALGVAAALLPAWTILRSNLAPVLSRG